MPLLLDAVGKEAQGASDVRPVRLRLQLEHLPYDVQQVAASLSGRYELLYAVAEEQGSYLVVIEDGAETQHGGNLGKGLALGLRCGAEQAGTAHIYQQHHREFALFFEHLHVRAAEPCGHIPVHAPHIVSPLVLTHFAERHTASFERGVVFACEDLVRERLGLDFDLADLLEQFSRVVHYGTMTALMTFSMICSVVTFSASAS